MEQLEEEEAEFDAWMQASQGRASVESTGKSRPSSDESSGKPDSDSGAGSSRKRARIGGKRKRSHHRSKGQNEDSPNVDVPLIVNEEMPGNADEPPEKRSREEEITGEGIILPLSLFISFHGFFHVLICFLFLLFLFFFF